MPIDPRYLSVDRLFREPMTFRVPKYQRSYAWEEEQLDDFLDDLEKCYEASLSGQRKHHFFGGIVSIAQSVPGSSRSDCEVVDGQQRLATFVILMSRVIKICEELSEQATAANDTENINLANLRVTRLNVTYLKFEDEVNRRPATVDKLTLSVSDNQFFREMVYNQTPMTTRDSHKRIKSAFTQIEAKLRGLINNASGIGEKLAILKEIEDILINDFTIIHISTNSRTEAYRLFQVLNDRGVSLSDGDLLRARTLEILDGGSFTIQQNTVEATWDKILSDSPKITEEFLRTYYSSVHGRRPKSTGLFDDFLGAFFPQHTSNSITIVEADSIVQTLNDMKAELEIYRNLREGVWPYTNEVSVQRWDTDRLNLLVRELPHTNCLPLLLAAAKLNQTKFAQIVNITERFVFRYKIICGAHVTPLTNVYYRQALQIRQNSDTYSVNSYENDLQTLLTRAPDSVFESHLNQLTYSPSRGNKQLRYFLMTLEHYHRWYENGARGNPQCMNKSIVFDFMNTSIEHVYPQNASTANRIATIERLKHNLGNLTFLGRNDNNLADDNTFDTKKPLLRNSSVQMNHKIANESVWTAAEVNSRQTILIDMAKKIFTV